MLDDAWRAVAELAASQHRAFTRAQAAAHRIDDRRLRTAHRQGRVTQHARNVFTFAGSPPTFPQQLKVATLLRDGIVASHRSAARLFGFDGVEAGPVEVTVPGRRGIRLPETHGIVLHYVDRLDRRDVVEFDGIPCTSKARTLVDLGSVVDPDTVLKALIGAHRTGTTLQVLRSTAERLHRPGQAGTGTLLAHLDRLVRAGAVPESWLEEVLRRIIDDPRLPRLVSQHRLVDAQGKPVARFDHAFPDVRLAIEGHSRAFHFGPVQEALDEDRDLRAARQGWQILYLGWYSTRRPAEVVDVIADVVAQRQHPPAA